MGMNYYAVKKAPSVYNRVIHIGKSSYGWLFLFHTNEKFRDYDQFVRFIENNKKTGEFVIMNEEDKEVNPDELIKLIQEKQNDPFNIENPDNFKYNRNIGGYRFDDREFC